MPNRHAHPFAPPPPRPARGCLAALAVAGAVLLASAGIVALLAGDVASPEVLASARPSTRVTPPAAMPGQLGAARHAWGEIRARYRLKHLMVPA